MQTQKFRNVVLWALSFLSAYLTGLCFFYARGGSYPDRIAVLQSMQGMRFESFILIIVGTFLYRKVYTKQSRTVSIWAAAGALIFSLCYFFGYNIYEYDTVWLNHYCSADLMVDLACLVGFFLLFNGILRWLLACAENHSVHPAVRKVSWFDGNLRSFFLYFSVQLVLYALLLFCFYPGITTEDSSWQIAEGLKVIPFDNHHPYAHTFLIGACVALGQALFGSIFHGVAVFTALQCILISAAVAWLLTYLARKNIHIGFRIAAFAYFLVHPIIISYSLTMWKDIWQSYFMLIYAALLIEVAVNPAGFFRSRENIILMAVSMLGILFFKKTGTIILLISFVFLIASTKGCRKKTFALIAACLMTFSLSNHILIPLLDIQPGREGEALSMPLQQIARTLSKNWDGVSQEQKDILNEIIPCEEISKCYNRDISDPVKALLNDQALMDNPGRYLKCWAEIGMQNPDIYLESILAGTAGYWYPGVNYWKLSTTSYLDGSLVNGSGYYGGFVDPNADRYNKEDTHPALRWWFSHKYDEFRQLPIIGFLAGVATYFWSCGLMFLVCMVKKKYRLLLPLSVILGVFSTCLVSPVFAECRYAFPAILIQPILWPFILQDDLQKAQN